MLAIVRIACVLLFFAALLFVRKTRVIHILSHRTHLSKDDGETVQWLRRLTDAIVDMWIAIEEEDGDEEDEEVPVGTQETASMTSNAGRHARRTTKSRQERAHKRRGQKHTPPKPSTPTYLNCIRGTVYSWWAAYSPFVSDEPFPAMHPARSTHSIVDRVERFVEDRIEEKGIATDAKFRVVSLGKQLPHIQAIRIVFPGPVDMPSQPSAAAHGGSMHGSRCGSPVASHEDSDFDWSRHFADMDGSGAAGMFASGEGLPPPLVCRAIEAEFELEYNGVGVDAYFSADLNLPNGRRLPLGVRVCDVSLFAHAHMRACLRFEGEPVGLAAPHSSEAMEGGNRNRKNGNSSSPSGWPRDVDVVNPPAEARPSFSNYYNDVRNAGSFSRSSEYDGRGLPLDGLNESSFASCQQESVGAGGGRQCSKKAFIDVEVWLESEPSFQFNLYTKLTKLGFENCFAIPMIVKFMALRWMRKRLIRSNKTSTPFPLQVLIALVRFIQRHVTRYFPSSRAETEAQRNDSNNSSSETKKNINTDSNKADPSERSPDEEDMSSKALRFTIPIPEHIVDGGQFSWFHEMMSDALQMSTTASEARTQPPSQFVSTAASPQQNQFHEYPIATAQSHSMTSDTERWKTASPPPGFKSAGSTVSASERFNYSDSTAHASNSATSASAMGKNATTGGGGRGGGEGLDSSAGTRRAVGRSASASPITAAIVPPNRSNPSIPSSQDVIPPTAANTKSLRTVSKRALRPILDLDDAEAEDAPPAVARQATSASHPNEKSAAASRDSLSSAQRAAQGQRSRQHESVTRTKQ